MKCLIPSNLSHDSSSPVALQLGAGLRPDARRCFCGCCPCVCKDASIVDIFWGPGIAGVVDIAAWLGHAGGPRTSTVLLLVNLWALRLAAHIWARHHGEDHRYAAMRNQVRGQLVVAEPDPGVLVASDSHLVHPRPRWWRPSSTAGCRWAGWTMPGLGLAGGRRWCSRRWPTSSWPASAPTPPTRAR